MKIRLAKLKNINGKLVIKLIFPYNTQDIIRIKTLPNRKFYNEEIRYWTCDLTPEAAQLLKNWEFIFCPKLQKYYQHHFKEKQTIKIIKNLKGNLLPFQLEGVNFIEKTNGRCLIADEMGLGKTIQVLAWLQYQIKIRPVIIIVPSSLKYNWKQEAEKWMEFPSIQVLSGTKPFEIIGQIIIINYDIIAYWIKELKEINPECLVIDECHYIKNNSAKRTKAIKSLAKNIRYIVGLSGTPILNRPIEIRNIITIIKPMLFPNFWTYVRRYCNAKHNGFGWDYNGASNTLELNNILKSTIMIRRLKKNVLRELPEKTFSFVPMKINNENEYKEAEENFINYLRKQKGVDCAKKAANAPILTQIEILKQLAVKGKMEQIINWINVFLESGEKLILFAVHQFVINEIMETFSDISVKIDGSIPNYQRQTIVEKFQKDPKIKIFVGNIKAAGVGLTLTASSNVAFIELPWTPGEVSQAADRADRIGQKNAVNVYYLLSQNTIETKIAHLIDEKRQVINSIMDGKKLTETSLISDLIKQFQNE